jgi:hypothetical protein
MRENYKREKCRFKKETKIILKREIEVGRVKGEYPMEGIINEPGETRDHVYSENGRA